jgi:hypothetical protein
MDRGSEVNGKDECRDENRRCRGPHRHGNAPHQRFTSHRRRA